VKHKFSEVEKTTKKIVCTVATIPEKAGEGLRERKNLYLERGGSENLAGKRVATERKLLA